MNPLRMKLSEQSDLLNITNMDWGNRCLFLTGLKIGFVKYKLNPTFNHTLNPKSHPPFGKWLYQFMVRWIGFTYKYRNRLLLRDRSSSLPDLVRISISFPFQRASIASPFPMYRMRLLFKERSSTLPDCVVSNTWSCALFKSAKTTSLLPSWRIMFPFVWRSSALVPFSFIKYIYFGLCACVGWFMKMNSEKRK